LYFGKGEGANYPSGNDVNGGMILREDGGGKTIDGGFFANGGGIVGNPSAHATCVIRFVH
jgi:hypothetical protein